MLAIAMSWFSALTTINTVLWRCEEKAISFGIYQISQSVVNSAATILLVIVFLTGWEGRVYSQIIASITFGLYSFFVLYRRGFIGVGLKKEQLKKIITFSLPLVPYAISFWFRSGASKILITNLCSLSDNGLFSVALSWGSIVSLFTVALSNAYSPFLYKKLSYFDKDKSGTINEQIRLIKSIRYLLIGIAITTIVIYFISCILIKLVYAPPYWASLEYLPWVMVGVAFDGFYVLFVGIVHYTYKTKFLGILAFVTSLMSILLSWGLILFIGSVGVAVSTAITSVLMFTFVLMYVIRIYRLPWRYLIIN
jgi:O-antigen/teichoic acid export membrane protein